MAATRGTNVASFERSELAEAFAAIPPGPRRTLLKMRALIFDTAAQIEDVGPIEETLRWGEPSYIPSVSKSGTTIRIHWKAKLTDHCAMYVHCQTNLVEQFRARHGGVLAFEGNRAVLVGARGPLPERALRDCIELALTYHLR